jgi:hypothetical protein
LTSSGRRPALVTWLAAGVLIFSVAYWLRFFVSLSLPPLPLTVPMWYLPLTGALWGVSGTLLAWGLFFGKCWAPALGGGLASVYIAWYWLDRLVFASSDWALTTRPAMAVLSLLGLAVFLWLLRRPALRDFIRERC